jgi:hypothetical protein
MRNGILLAALLSVTATAARADGDYLSPTQDRVRVSLGVMQASAATSFQLDSSGGNPGSVIDGENTLGLDRSRTEPRFEAEIRAGERHRIRIDYFSLDRDDTRTLAGAPLAYGNVILLAGDPVQTDLSVRAFGITYGYSFVRNDRFELAGTLSVSDMDVDSRLRVATAAVHVDVSHTIAGAFPTPGLEATWVLSKRFYLDAHADYLKVAIDKLSGSLGRYEMNALYRLRPNVSFALGYSGIKSDLSSRRSGQTGFADLDARGPQFTVRVAF